MHVTTLRRYTIGVVLVSLMAATCPRTNAAVKYDFRAFTRDIAPGTSPELKYLLLQHPTINANGQVAFSALIPDISGEGYSGIWSEGGGSLGMVFLRGEAAPDMPSGIKMHWLEERSLLINGSGQIAFILDVYGPGVDRANEEGIWTGDADSLRLVARSGEAAPGVDPSIRFESFRFPELNIAGQIAFLARTVEPGVTNDVHSQGIWSTRSGSLKLVAHSRGVTPNELPDSVFQSLSTPAFNDAGQIAFSSEVWSPGGYNKVIWSDDGGSTRIVAKGGDAAPGTDPGVVFDSTNYYNYGALDRPELNNAGQVAFRSMVAGLGVDTTNQVGIWSEGGGSLNLVARQGNAAPDTEPGVLYDSFSLPELNETGQTAFRASLTGFGVDSTNQTGIWSEGSGTLKLIARSGGEAPGTKPEEVFSGFLTPMLNGPGQTAFIGTLTGPDIDSMNDRGVWVTDLSGVLKLIARTGDTIDVNNDPLIEDLRTIIRIDLAQYNSSTKHGVNPSFNDSGQIAMLLEFTNATQAVVIATVPEPGALVMVAAGVPWLLRRYR